ncbi:MAG TPA: MerR family transcriptional regulator [Kineosporiaceae bacterium]|nr:MerR family transcriptional regulator [Kineosporiaceae bacterium]
MNERAGRLRTVDVARESGYSVQQVRDLERLRIIPPATRSANGYRSYAPIHLHALRAYRGLASATGPVAARRLLAQLRSGTITDAAAAVNAVHAGLARERAEALSARAALAAIESEANLADAEREGDAMTITELAAALAVRASTLRFWEQEGLVLPERVTSLRARRYGVAAVRQARIVAALRSSGYGVPAVREVLETLHQLDGLAAAQRILDQRLNQIAERSVALLRAGADLATVIEAP